jgi:flagellin
MPVISTNTAANSAVRYLNINSMEQSASLSKLASGSRINKASDDAAGLAIATRIQSEITALEQAATNASHGISVLQTADGGASNIGDILQRMKSLASQAASGTVTDTERAYIQAEFAQLVDEVNGTASSTRYNGQSLLDGTSEFATGVTVMVGSDSSDTIRVTISALTSLALGLSSAAPTAAADLVGGAGGYDATGGNVSFDVNGVTVALTTTGGTAGVYTAAQIVTAINAALVADDPATTVSAAVDGVTGNLTISNSATGITSLIELDNFTGGLTATDLGFTDTSNRGTDGTLSVGTQIGAQDALDVLDAAIDTVSNVRAELGATMSRFEFRSGTIATSTENLEAANSAIIDVDIAAEQSRLASAKVKTQAAVAAAAQANQMPQDLLQLLR